MIVGAAVRFVGIAYFYFATWTFCNQERSLTYRRKKAHQMEMDFFRHGCPAGEFQGHGPSHVGPSWIQRIPLRWRRNSDASSGLPLAPTRCSMPVPFRSQMRWEFALRFTSTETREQTQWEQ